MLHRSSSSSRRRRASRSAATSPNPRVDPTPSLDTAAPRRGSLVETPLNMSRQRSPRASLAPNPDGYNRSPRQSLAPEPIGSRSARNSLIPDAAISPRNSLTPGPSRNNLAPDVAYGSRLSLNPQDFNRSPRNSITPDASARTPRRSLVPDPAAWSQPRNSLVPDVGRSPRHSVASIQIDSGRKLANPEPIPNPRTSPRGSIAPDVSPAKAKETYSETNRSPRGSLVTEGGERQRSPRGSLAPGAVGTGDSTRISPRGSLTLTFQEPLVSKERRASDDSSQATTRGRSVSPYRGSLGGGGGGSRGTQINHGFSGSVFSETGSRRASSSVSQVSGDEQRRLCGEQSKYGAEGGLSHGLGLGLTTYGSVAYQLKDANMEASGTCDFVCRAVRIVNRTIVMTVFLACLSTLPLIMLIMGVQYIRDCPAEPHLPVYMVVGGAAGGTRLCWLLWSQLAARSVAVQTVSIPERFASWILTIFLIAWHGPFPMICEVMVIGFYDDQPDWKRFGLGNYWALRIKWPDFEPSLFEPNKWCHRTLYVFALVQLCIVWGVVFLLVLLSVVLAFCQVFGCGWLGPPRYK